MGVVMGKSRHDLKLETLLDPQLNELTILISDLSTLMQPALK